MTHIAGVFDSKQEANAAVSRLLDTGFNKENLSLIVTDNAPHTIFTSPTDDEGARITRGGAAGALFGGAFGALVSGIALVGAIAVPSSGIFMEGPLVAMFAGIGVGVLFGSLSGVLISAAFAVDEAKHYEKEIRHGKAVVIINTSKETANAARTVLLTSNATIKQAA